MKNTRLVTTLAAFMLAAAIAAAGPDEFYKYTNTNPGLPEHSLSKKDFGTPSGFAKPQTWWHWINGNVSREGIEADLREMADKGLGSARIFSINSKYQGPLIFASPEWFDTFKFTVETAAKRGMGIGIHNCDGWSEAGGPWITPALSMKELTLKTIRITGGDDGAEQAIPLPELDRNLDFVRDVAVLAWPAKRPAMLAMHRPGVLRRAYPSNKYTNVAAGPREFVPGPGGLALRGGAPAAAGPAVLFDGMADEKRVAFSYDKNTAPKGSFTGVTLEFSEPFEAAGVFAEMYWVQELPLNIFLEASDDGVDFERVCELKFRRSDTTTAFAPRRAKYWRIVRYLSTNPTERVIRGAVREHEMRLSEIELLAPGENSRAAFPIENFPAKSGAATVGGLAPDTTAPYPEKFILKPGEIQNLTASAIGLVTDASSASPDAPPATLRWRVPAGEWVVMRIGYTTTGKTIHPATPAGRGLEVDKFDPSAVEHHFDSYDRKMIAAAGALAGKTFTVIETDSWEAGHQNWSKNFARCFREQNDYDIIPWLPVYAGECIQSVGATENFLRDLRRTFSSLIMGNFYGKLGSLTRAAGLKYETEHSSLVYMRDPMNSFREADYPMPEVWQEPREPGFVAGIRPLFTREAASAAHFYGKQYVTCEALTSRKGNWSETPWAMKGTLDTLLFAGSNLTVFHTYTHQPDERAPGWQMEPWGIAQNRKLPWWPLSKAWFSYVARVQYMLQQGKYAARILYLYADEIPAGNATLATKTGHQYDIINGDGLRDFLRVKNGRLLSPGRMRYDVLFISPHTTLRLETLEKLKSFLEAGVTIAARAKPAINPSLRGGQAADSRWRALADELFGDGSKAVRKIGAGRLFTGCEADEVLDALSLPVPFTSRLFAKNAVSDLAWLHREHADGTEWFWVANRDSTAARSGIMSFRVAGKAATLWHPETGKIEPAPAAFEKDGYTHIPFSLEKLEGVFVVFENKTPPPATAVKIVSGGAEIFPMPAEAGAGALDNTKITGNFTFAVTVSPSGDRKITQAASSGICPGKVENENFVLFPESMHKTVNDKRHVGAGLSVGRNSIAVFEHGEAYLNSIIVWNHPVAENTQVAVVYKNNTPALYINGKKVAAAAKPSGRIVHPPSAVRSAYKGKAADYMLEASPAAEEVDNIKTTGDFTFAVTVSPSANRKLTQAASSGICPGKFDNENFVFFPDALHKTVNDRRHAGAGLSVGRNSIAVFEHGDTYLNSIIVWNQPVPENTQVAVVYKNNTPALYINGKQVAAAAKPSGRIVHPPAAVRSAYKGRVENFIIAKSAMSAPEIAALADDPPGELVLRGAGAPRAKSGEPHLFMTDGGRLAAEFAAPDKLEIQRKNGSKIVLAADSVPAPKSIPGPFTVAFDSKWGAPAQPRQFATLASWTENADPGIKHYSGAAVYTKQIEISASDIAPGIRVYLEIDQVGEVAEVALNGKPAGTLWRPPYRTDLTDYIKKGQNELSITVANTWVNRCLYDATLPEDKRLTWANSMQTHFPKPDTIKPGEYFPWQHGPLPSGLIGKMRLVYTRTMVEPR